VPTEYIAAAPEEIARHDAEAVRQRHYEFPLELGGPRRHHKDSRETEIM
jgi:hypothetical protein